MNKTKIRRVALALLTGELAMRKRGKKIGYNQNCWSSDTQPDHSGHKCGTTACIGGTAIAIFEPSFRGLEWGSKAQEILGLTNGEREALFTSFVPIKNPTAKQAAMVLFHFAETGKVDWRVAA